ncbi:MAG: EamA family transporter [Elusimicrobia bacterium]|nr:EamA family transporter [Elusimicrobiota bacterium]
MSYLGLVYCSAVWGATFFMVKDALADVGAVPMVAYRFLLAALCLLPWVLRHRRPAALLWEGFILSLILAGLYVSQTVSLGYTTASNCAFITGLFVVLVPLYLLAFYRRPLRPAQWLAVTVAVAGLWLLTGGLSGVNRGDALSLVAAATYAGHLLFTDKCVRAEADVVLLAFHQFWMTAALAFLACAALRLPMAVAGPRGWGVILFLALFPTLSAFFLQILIQKKLPPLTVSLGFSLEPVFAALFAWTVGGEAFVGRKAVGGLFIVAAMVLGELNRFEFLKARRKEVLPV